MNAREALLSQLIDETVPNKGVEKSGRQPLRMLVRGLAAAALAAAPVYLPAALTMPDAGAHAVEVTRSCSSPRFIARSHTRYCPNVASHYTHDYQRTTRTWVRPNTTQVCHHFQSRGWMIGCQEMVGPFHRKTCRLV